MKVKGLQLKSYRNYGQLDLLLDPGINILLGANAQGKTNIIEAIYYASLGESHRTHSDGDLIQWNKPATRITMSFERMEVPNQVEFQLSHEKRRVILFNGKSVRISTIIGSFNAVLFSPEDLLLIKGAPALRRRFLDGEISQASPSYYKALASYNKIVAQRNTLLKNIREQGTSAKMLDVWDSQLAIAAAQVYIKRQEAVRKLNMLANLMQRRISGNQENLTVSYYLKGSDELPMAESPALWYNEMIARYREKDIMRGSTSLGPHHDDIILEINGVNLRAFGSQGQQRTGILALKLAELEFIRSENGEYPVLLLDDVMSELDEGRRRQLLDFIGHEKIQTIISATDGAYFPVGSPGKRFQVEHGIISAN